MNILAEFKGQNGILYIYDEYIEISRKSFGGIISQGVKGNRRFYYSNIVSIEYKTPTWKSNGYFKIIAGGTQDINAGVGFFSSSRESMKDPNTVVLSTIKKSISLQCDEIYEIAMKQLKMSKCSNNSKESQFNHLDELKKLGELFGSGILTKEEFEREKIKILSRS